MKRFLDKDFLLDTEISQELYESVAAPLPIIDYHSHVSPQSIAKDKCFNNITQLWLGTDHYKWRLMRWCGVEERLITGDATDKEKFIAFSECLPRAIGNPVYHWIHLELQRYFDCYDKLDGQSAARIWDLCNDKLQNGLTVREIIRASNVAVICTTDDPIDDLRWHRQLVESSNIKTRVYPSFRPDKAITIDKPEFSSYVKALEKVWGHSIQTLDNLLAALIYRLDTFAELGCRTADHGLDMIPWTDTGQSADEIFRRRMAGGSMSFMDIQAYQTALLLALGTEYHKRGMVMQLHYGVQRNVNPVMFKRLGSDTGFDCIDTPYSAKNLALLLGKLAENNALPKTVLYSINPADNAMLVCLAGSFPKEGFSGWVQHGCAWWFNDTRGGMERQLSTLAEMGVLGSFIGMLTDSRCFTSYTRHEYYRRTLCRIIGRWVTEGEFPRNTAELTKLVRDVSFNNANLYFNFGVKVDNR